MDEATEPSPDLTYGQRIEMRRLALLMSPRDLAVEVGIGTETLRGYEKDVHYPRSKLTRLKIEEALSRIEAEREAARERRWLTVEEIGLELQVATKQVYRWIRSGDLEAIWIVHQYRVSPAALAQFLSNSRVTLSPAAQAMRDYDRARYGR